MACRFLPVSKVTLRTTLAALLISIGSVACGVSSSSVAPVATAVIEPSASFALEPTATGTLSPASTSPLVPTAKAQPTLTFTPKPTMPVVLSLSPDAEARPTPCELLPVVVPTLPAEIPNYAQLDRTTGLHITGTFQEIDLDSYRLKVTGKVDNPLSLSYDDLRCMPKSEVHCKLVCPETFVDEATWAGVPLEYVLELAAIHSGAEGIKLISADGYAMPVSMTEVRSERNLVAYEWEGEPLPILHGFPVRAVFPESMGSRWVKWLVEIEVY